MSEPTLVVRAARGKGALTILGGLVLAAVGVAMALGGGGVLTTLLGIITALFFGAVCVVAAPKVLRGDRMLSADATGLYPADGGVVPWANVEAFGSYREPNAGVTLALRIRDTESYIASFTEDERRRMASRIRLARVAGVTDIAGWYAWGRSYGGWDMIWPQGVLDHRVEDVLRRCERLRHGDDGPASIA